MPFSGQSYLRLPSGLYDLQAPLPVSAPETVVWNDSLAGELGFSEDPRLFAGNRLPEDLTPLSQAYAGHQFGHFTMLGDGRAVLLGEAQSGSGHPVDVQLKGSGRTKFSRGGDGRAALEPMLREYLISEAMHALGIPTTRALCVVKTGDPVYRETVLPGAVLTRIASSHLRVGTFEYASGFHGEDTGRALAEFAIRRHDPDCESVREFFRGVLERQAALVAKWMAVGFVHGVMNTDNMAVSGETIDYGPCAFMDTYDPETVFSSIDQQGRYAYGNQPRIAHWNLAVLAGSLLPVAEGDAEKAEEKFREELDRFPEVFRNAWQKEMNAKIGLSSVRKGDDELAGGLLETMHAQRRDYTRTFLDLDPERPLPGLEAWQEKWRARLEGEEGVRARMRKHNPAVIPRNHRVEAAFHAAGRGDLKPFLKLAELLSDPYRRDREYGELAEAPPKDAPAYRTFCGT